jgi:hypothetical protein
MSCSRSATSSAAASLSLRPRESGWGNGVLGRRGGAHGEGFSMAAGPAAAHLGSRLRRELRTSWIHHSPAWCSDLGLGLHPKTPGNCCYRVCCEDRKHCPWTPGPRWGPATHRAGGRGEGRGPAAPVTKNVSDATPPSVCISALATLRPSPVSVQASTLIRPAKSSASTCVCVCVCVCEGADLGAPQQG